MKKVLLIGNPNCGKTSVFNALTGKNLRVGNFCGVTVEEKSAKYSFLGEETEISDLPGLYSLCPFSPEEKVSSDSFFSKKTDVIINVIDITNLKRNLFLTTQLLEEGVPMIIALNFSDKLKTDEVKRLVRSLSVFKVPVIPISARKHKGLDVLKKEILKAKPHKTICPILNSHLEKEFIKEFKNHEDDLYPFLSTSCVLEKKMKKEVSKIRYDYIDSLLNLKFPLPKGEKPDKILTHPVFSIPIFLFITALFFHLSFSPSVFGSKIMSVGFFLSSLIEHLIEYLKIFSEDILHSFGCSGWFIALINDAVISGIGSVLSFIPSIALMFLFISVLEDSGYMSRISYFSDRFLSPLSLSGKSILPLITGFGCSVPAFLGCRVLENKKERRLTYLLIPYMSCGAKLPVYAFLASRFFPKNCDEIIFFMYVLGCLCAVLSAIILKNAVGKSENTSFMSELVPYKIPSIKNVSGRVFDKVVDFLKRCGGVIFFSSVFLWLLSNHSLSLSYVGANSDLSILSSVSKFSVPVFSPLGFCDWKIIVSLFSGLISREVIVSSLKVLDAIPLFSVPSALSFLTFCLLGIPCTSACLSFNQEERSKLFKAFCFLWWFSFSWLMSFLVYRISLILLNI